MGNLKNFPVEINVYIRRFLVSIRLDFVLFVIK